MFQFSLSWLNELLSLIFIVIIIIFNIYFIIIIIIFNT